MDKKSDIKVSIITVVYNGAATIETTIKSVLGQTYDNIEYIIIDGKSTDDTMKIVGQYSKSIDCIVSEPDKGIYDAMNKGISKANGDIIGIINSDDYYELDAVSQIIYAFKNTNADVVYGKARRIHENGYFTVSKKEPLDLLNYRMIIQHPTVFVKRKVYRKLGLFDIKYKIAADYDFLLRIYNMGMEFYYIDNILANFSLGGTSSTDLLTAIKEFREVALSHISSGEKRDKWLGAINNLYDENMRYVNEYNKNNEDIVKQNKEIIERFVNEERSVYIWGCGAKSLYVYRVLTLLKVTIEGYIDSDPEKQNKTMGKLKVYSPSVVEKNKKKVVIASSKYDDEIRKQLIELGYKQSKDFISVNDLK